MQPAAIRPGNVLITEVAAANAGTLFRGGTRTLAAFTDLVNICEAAVMADVLLATPRAILSNPLLLRLDCLAKWTIVEDGQESPGHPGNLDDHFAASSELSEDEVFGGLVNLALVDDRDPGEYAFGKLAVAAWLSQARHDGSMLDEPRRQFLLERFARTFAVCDRYAASLVLVYEALGIPVVASVVEQPLVDPARLAAACASPELDAIYAEIRSRTTYSIDEFRGLALKSYRLPAVGLLAVARAGTLDDLPRQVAELRDRFAPLRATIHRLEVERRDAVAAGEAGLRELKRIKLNMETAFEAFSRAVADDRIVRDVRRVERVIDGARYFDSITGLVTSLGLSALSSMERLLEALRVRQKLHLKLVPGLFQAAAVLRQMEVDTVSGVVERYIGLPPEKYVLAKTAMDFCFYQLEHRYEPFSAKQGEGVSGFRIDEVFIPGGEFWQRLIEDDAFRDAVLFARLTS